MNRIIITGRLTDNVELKTVGSGLEMCEFTVAVDRRTAKDTEKKTDFFTCTAWRATAAFVAKYFHKGDGITLEGAMHNDPYEDKETGKKRQSWKLMIQNVEFALGKGKNSPAGEPASQSYDAAEPVDESALPF